ncbi:MAG: hypothetical protein M3Q15_05765 [Pseudomonadota bacterium]|nr:hypothetical protein [Pseudomonadota bacterium]
MTVLRIILLGGLSLSAAACVPRTPPPPEQPQQRQPAPRPLPPAPPPASADWRDFPLSQGAWVYSSQPGSTQALFGPANSEASFIVRCDRARRQISLSREGNATGTVMTIRTSNSARNLPATFQPEPLAYATAQVAATDPILDSMAFSRGRFTVELAGTPLLVVPAWPELARAVEDCR